MKNTLHIDQRMNQRGISQEMVELVMQYGIPQQERTILGKKEAEKLLARLQRDMKVLKKILDKGGVVVVASEDTVITTYNYKQAGRH